MLITLIRLTNLNYSSSGPVTFGQLSMLRSLEFYGPAFISQINLPQAWPIAHTADFAAVEAAWLRIFQVNRSLRTIYEFDGPEPIQRVLDVPPAPIEPIELDEDSPEAAQHQARKLSQRVFAIDREPPCAAVIGMHEGRPRFLISAFHHIVTDLGGIQSMQRQINALLAGQHTPFPQQPLDLAADQRSAVDRHNSTLDYWLRQWPEFAPEDRLGPDVSPRFELMIHSYDALSAAEAVSHRLGVSLSSVVLASTYIALARTQNRNQLTLALMASNRFNERWDSLVSAMNQLAPLAAIVSDDAKVCDFFTDVYASSLEAYMYGTFNEDILERRLRQAGNTNPEPLDFDYWFNFRGHDAEVPPASSPAISEIEWLSPRWPRTGPSFYLIAGTGESGITLNAMGTRRVASEERFARLVCAIESILISAAENTEARVGDLDTRPRRAVTQAPPHIS